MKQKSKETNDLTERICQALQEVKQIEDGKLEAESMDNLLDTLPN